MPARRLAHTCDLLPPHLTAAWAPALARLAGQPLDAGTFDLVVYFEPRGGGGGAGVLHTYELFVEPRGDGAYKVCVGRQLWWRWRCC